MVALFLISEALAGPAPVVGSVSGRMEAGTGPEATARTGGVELRLGGATPGRTFELGGMVAGHGGSAGFVADGRAQARMWLADPSHGPSLVLDYGVRRSSAGLAPAGSVGVAWDLPRRTRTGRLRLGGGLQVHGITPDAGVFTVGWAWGPPAAPVADAPEPEPEGAPARFPDDTRIWLPHPVCRWVSEAELDDVLADLPDDQRAQVHAAAHATLFTQAGELDGAALRPAPQQGALLVVGEPGDRVRVGEREVSAGVDGVVQLTVPEGMVTAEVVGGGRRATVSAAISVGHGTWVRVSDPAPAVVEFAAGSASLGSEAREVVAALARDAGGWRYELQGGFSPEGNRAANVALATRRAEAVRAAFLEAGLSPDQVAVVPAAVPEDATDAASRRVCTVRPRPADGGTP